MDIKFIAKTKKYEPVLKLNPPISSNQVLPEWYKKLTRTEILDNGLTGKTAKKCPAIQDILSTGFVIPMFTRLEFASTKNEDGIITGQNWHLGIAAATGEDISQHLDYHHPYQVKGMDLNKTVDNTVLKMSLPYRIVVPEGYNIKYSDPFYHFRKDIRCLPGIVEADKWGYVAFPFEILSDNFIIEPGTPLIHCLVYKRDEPLNLIMQEGTQKDYDKVHEDFFELFSSDVNYRTK
jgi:hypothetical protein